MTRADVAAALEEVATLMALVGENDFRSRAYAMAARSVETLDGDLGAMVAAGKLAGVRGLGSGMTEKVVELVSTGRLAYLDELRAKVPAGVRDMLRVNGLGPKKVKALHDVLGIDSVAALQAACEANRVAAVKGFGDKTQQKILAAVRYLGSTADRVRLDKGLPVGEWLVEQVRQLPGVTRAELAGEVRRRCETVAELVVVAAIAGQSDIRARFNALPGMVDGRLDFELRGKKVKLSARLVVSNEVGFSADWLIQSGSDAHIAQLHARGPFIDGTDEVAVYDALGLNWVPPELREGTDEIDLAASGDLPELVELADIRGVFHNHTTASDGHDTLEAMARAALALGYEYLGIGDHSQSLVIANGLSPARVRKQWEEIDALNKSLPGIRVLKGTESDILPDGSLDFDDDLLAGFEYVVGSVHTHFSLSEADQTARVCKALAHPRLTMLGHPTGRLLLRRVAYPIDLDRVVRTAADHGKMIEINAQPNRLDLDGPHCRLAQKLGVPLVINPDAHDVRGLGLVPWGVHVARRAGLTRADVFNTRPLAAVLRELDRRRVS